MDLAPSKMGTKRTAAVLQMKVPTFSEIPRQSMTWRSWPGRGRSCCVRCWSLGFSVAQSRHWGMEKRRQHILLHIKVDLGLDLSELNDVEHSEVFADLEEEFTKMRTSCFPTASGTTTKMRASCFPAASGTATGKKINKSKQLVPCRKCGRMVHWYFRKRHVLEQHISKPGVRCPLCNYSANYNVSVVRKHISVEHEGQSCQPIDCRSNSEVEQMCRDCFGLVTTWTNNFKSYIDLLKTYEKQEPTQ